MKLMQITLAAAATLFMTASMAAACDGKAHGTTASGDQAKATPVSGEKAGCAKAMKASGSGCGMKAMTASGDKAGCASKAKAGCCAKGEPTMATIDTTADPASCKFKAGEVAFKGTVVCNHCDLQKADTCKTMFRTSTGCLFALSGDKAKDLREAAVGGKKVVRIKGTLGSDGQLAVSSYRVVRSLDSGASAM